MKLIHKNSGGQAMANITKLALEAALKKELLTKSLDKITINELAEDCGISRMAFYYHFKDIYDLVEWVCVEDGTKALQGKKTYENWQEGFCQIFEAVQELSLIHISEPTRLRLTYQLIADVVEEKCTGMQVAEEHKEFIAGFYKYGFVGVMLDWIDRGMKDDYHKIVEELAITLYGNISRSIENFEHTEKKI